MTSVVPSSVRTRLRRVRHLATVLLCTALVLVCSSATLCFGATLLSENFDASSSPPSGWTDSYSNCHFVTPIGASHLGSDTCTSARSGTRALTGYQSGGSKQSNPNQETSSHVTLTTSTINCTGVTGVQLKFWSWIINYPQYVEDQMKVEVSGNGGSTWSTVWQLPTGSQTRESAWTEHTYDISSVADNQSNVKIRFVTTVTNNNCYCPGWVIDDMTVTGTGSPPVANFSGSPTSGTAPLTVNFTDSSTNSPTSWSWSFGDGGTSTSQNPSHQYTSAGNYTVTLTATNAYGSDPETKTNYITVTVPPPVANFSGAPTSGTAPLTVNFTDSSTNSPTSWSWNFGDSSTSTSQNPSHQYTTAGSYTVTLTATNAGGSDPETKTNYITVTVAVPVANFSGSPTSGTAPLTVNFTDSSTNSPTSWSWSFGDGGTSTAQNPSHQYTSAGNYTVTLTATNASGSDDETKTNYITVSGGGGPVTLLSENFDASSNPPSGWTDSYSNCHFVTPIGASHLGSDTCTSARSGTRAFTGYQSGGSKQSNPNQETSSHVTLTTPAINCTGVAGTQLKFWSWIINYPQYVTDQMKVEVSGNGGSSWSTVWQLPTGAETRETAWTEHTYDISSVADNQANVKIRFVTTVTNNNCYCPGWVVDDVTVTGTSGGSPPVANFSGTPTSGTAPLTVNFTDSSTNSPTSWSWNFGDSSTSTSQNPSHQYTSAGQFTVTLTATNAGGSDSETKTDYITVSSGGGSSPAFVAPGAVAYGTGTITPALPSGIQSNDILLLFVETANQAASISNQNGGSWVAVTNSPQGTGTAGGTSATRLTAFWSRYNGTQGAPTVSDSGNHQIGRIVAIRGVATTGDPWNVTAGGVESTSDTSGAIPGATTTAANTLVVAAIATALPDASGTANFSAWANSDLTNVTERTDNTGNAGNGGGLAVATGEKATAGAYGSTAVTCGTATAKAMLSIALKPAGGVAAPVANFSGTPTSGAAPLTVNFTDSSTNSPTAWSWSFGDGGTSTSQNPSHQYTSAGNYTVALTATNAGGSDDEVKTNYITVASIPIADFIGSPTSGSAPLTVSFSDSSVNSPTSWSWNFGDSGTSTVQNPSHQYTSNGLYTVSLTATNAYGSDDEVKTNYITVSDSALAPVADFVGFPVSGITPLTVAFKDMSWRAPTSWSWNFGDGSTSTAQNPTHQYTSNGVRTVSLTATNSYGSDSETKSNYIFSTTDLLDIPTRGGTVLRWPGLDLDQPNAEWAPWCTDVAYESSTQSYKFTSPTSQYNTSAVSGDTITVQRNRRYILSALIKCDFNRIDEISMDVFFYNSDGLQHCFQSGGVPNLTQGSNGWTRWEREFVTSPIEGVVNAELNIDQYNSTGTAMYFRIKDVALVELPADSLTSLARDEGVTFRGGPGSLGMSVEGHSTVGNTITVTTTGAKYTFDTANNTILQEQRIDFQRELSLITSSVSLSGLTVRRYNAKECVLSNTNVTFGVQCDTALVISPQVAADFTVQSKIGGRWNRLRTGNLLALDDFGGFSVNPYIPLGTGLTPSATALDTLDFAGVKNLQMGFGAEMNSFLSSMSPGWRVKWSISPGVRLFVSAAPPRPYNWEKSWTYRVGISTGEDPSPWGTLPISGFEMWMDPQRSFGGSYGPVINPRNPTQTIQDFATIVNNGQKPLPYLSMYFWYNRNAQEYVNEVKRWRDTYGSKGMYSDGYPTIEWITAYEELRLLREAFPDGDLHLHATLGPPIGQADIYIPFIATYADFTSMAEGYNGSEGANWPYARYIMGAYRKHNTFGDVVGTHWTIGGTVDKEKQENVLINYNGRSGWYWEGEGGAFMNDYIADLNTLEGLWNTYGSDPYFFDRYFQPKANELSGYTLGRAGMPIVTQQQSGSDWQITLSTQTSGGTIRYTTNGSEPTSSSTQYTGPFTVSTSTTVKAVTFKTGLDQSVTAVKVAGS